MTAVTPGAARSLRDATRGDHASTEHSPFMTALLGGLLPLDVYADLLVQLRPVYVALEAAAAAYAGDPLAGPFVDAALDRTPSIERDLGHLAGRDWPARFRVTDAAASYTAAVAQAEPATFVAHHYTRYLGDLSGGQVIGRIVRRTYGLDGSGTAFYEFPSIPDAKAYKDAYRARLDGCGLDPAALAADVAEAYALNAAVFTALAERHLS